MSGDRWTVLGLARPRTPWFGELARWSTSAAVPVDFVKCVSAAEARARLHAGRPFSALLLGADAPGVDRDLVATATAVGTATLLVGPGAVDPADLGAATALPVEFDRLELEAALRQHATPVARIVGPPPDPPPPEPGWRGRLVAVTGPGGAGTSVTAMALAQRLAAEPSNRAHVLLADLALHAEQAMLHDAREVVPGVQELVEAHRSGRLGPARIRDLTFEIAGHDHHLLLGLRRHRDWTAVRAGAFEAALDGLLRSYRVVVADLDPELEGQVETGSLDIEDRNLLSRLTVLRAELTVVVGAPDTKGLHALARTVRDLLAHGVDPERILTVLNRAPRARRRRAGATRALAELLDGPAGRSLDNPVFVAERADVEAAIRDGARLPGALSGALHAEITRRLGPSTATAPVRATRAEPVPVRAGTLGTWTREAG